MPNWVANTLKCYVKDHDAFLATVGAEHQVMTHTFEQGEGMVARYETCREPFCFWNIIAPKGEELSKYEESMRDPNVRYDKDIFHQHSNGMLRHWTEPYWYGWNVDHWGTKWDASDVEITVGFIIEITFSTAWSPPIPAIQGLAERFPNDEFHLRYVEEQGWGGYVRFKANLMHEDVVWDSTNSHKQAVLLEGYCACFDSALDPEAHYRPFMDCPPPLAPAVAVAS